MRLGEETKTAIRELIAEAHRAARESKDSGDDQFKDIFGDVMDLESNNTIEEKTMEEYISQQIADGYIAEKRSSLKMFAL